MGSTTLQQHGQEEHAAGQAEENQAKTQGYVEGLKDRVAGAKDSMLGSMTGDKSKQAQGGSMSEEELVIFIIIQAICGATKARLSKIPTAMSERVLNPSFWSCRT